jgi:hypothetical protein
MKIWQFLVILTCLLGIGAAIAYLINKQNEAAQPVAIPGLGTAATTGGSPVGPVGPVV